MADQTVKVVSDTKERVAYDLMNRIASETRDSSQMNDKKYWLSLYRQCYKAADGCALETILKEEG